MAQSSCNLEQRAQAALGNRNLAMQWLNSANPLLEGSSPVEAVATAQGRRKVAQQLAWFAGQPVQQEEPVPQSERLQDLVGDPLIQLVLKRAGSGPEELLRLYRKAA